ncbi:MAG: DUF885 domain-containing protein [Lachnospiraceae bacterium]|nr:DUF885 domain-containing protein [Lachnospiraceae bacterium]
MAYFIRNHITPEAKNSDRKKGENSSSALRYLLLPLFAASVTLLICHLVTNPPSFLQTEEQRFVSFTEEIFREELSQSTLNLHYLIANPSEYGLGDAEVTLGSSSLKAREAALAALENYQESLSAFDYEKLSENRQLTYDVFADYLETELSAAEFLLYDEPLGPTLGVQAQLPILLAEYAFRTKGDIEDYLTLLAQIPDYFDSILSFEQKKSEAGLFMSSECALDVIEQCLDFASNTDDHYLIEIFDEKIDAVSNLTADEKIAYKARNQAILAEYVLPAWQSLAAGLAALEGTGTNEMGLYYYPDGQKYYEYLVKSNVGDSRSMEEIEEQIKTQMVADYTAMQELLVTEGEASGTANAESTAYMSLLASGTEESSEGNTPASMLEDLRQKITADFPLLPAVSCEIKYVHESLQAYLSPAFYLTPTIDDYTANVIYINPAGGYSGVDLYTTLAHEGYPGHLYQSVYFASQSPDLLRSLLDVGGYTEGWATYAELYAYTLYDSGSIGSADSDSSQSQSYRNSQSSQSHDVNMSISRTASAGTGNHDTEISRLNRSFTLGLASLLDIGIHYRGYTREEVSAFLTALGFSDETADSLYTAILEAPANYLQYYVGYLDFVTLRDTLAEAVESFTLKSFHQAVLEIGPAPFDILEAWCRKKLADN